MKFKKLIPGAIVVALLSGCAHQQPTVVKSTNGSSLEVATLFTPPDMNNNRYADPKLREVTPAVSGVGMGLSVMTAVLGGGISSNAFDKSNYKGNAIDAMPEPTASYLTPKAGTVIRQWLDKQGSSYAYTQPLYIGAAQWSLVYSDMSADNSNYDLTYRVLFYKRPEGGNIFSAYIISECAPAVKTAALSDWRANQYQKVSEETRKMMDSCVLELENQRPRLLKR